MIAAALIAPKAYWYLTRGTGTVALLLLTASVALGVITTVRWRSPRWPRFALAGLHRNLTLLSIVFVVTHVLTTVLDGYAPVRLEDALIPFVSHYRPVWLGLGAVAFDLLLTLVVTSLLRARIGYRLWRGTHWLAYTSWPVALMHALGTGSDARTGFMRAVGLAAVAVVVVAVLARAVLAYAGPLRLRVAGAAAAIVVPVSIGLWYESGPAQHGWAKRAGTPAALLARKRVPQAANVEGTVASPRMTFSASLHGRIQEAKAPNGLVNVVITGRLAGGSSGAVRIDLRGQPLQGGVAMTASGVSYVPGGTRTVYRGSVTTLAGQDVLATLSAPSFRRLQLAFRLNIDTAAGTVSGTVDGSPLTSE